jgi:hypothetical protein
MDPRFLWGEPWVIPILSATVFHGGDSFSFADEFFNSARFVSQRSIAHSNDGQPRGLPGRMVPNPVFADPQPQRNFLCCQERVNGSRAFADLRRIVRVDVCC